MTEKPSASSRQDPPPSSESRNGGAPILTVTQQIPTSPHGKTKTQMSQPSHPLTIPNHPAPPPPSLEPAVVQSVTSSSPHLPKQTHSGVVPTLRAPALPRQGVIPTLRAPALPPHGVVPTLHVSSPLSPEGLAPTLRDLCLLPVPNWYLLGVQLGVSADELDVIGRNYPRDNDMCKAKMFGAWLRMDTSATYERLARALVTVGKRSIAESMCTARGIPRAVLDDVPVATVDPLPPRLTLPPDLPECVARYAQYLKDKYKRMFILPDGDWPPSIKRQYTRLALIERKRELPGAELVATMERDYIRGNIDNIVKRKKAIQLPEVFLATKDGGQELKILMDGAPGVGKSTLSRKICKDWASGELLKQYHLVILLPLRQTSIREATSIEDLIEADDPDLKQQVVQHIQKTSGEHILLIVDGYDEIGYKDRTKNSLFLNIVQGNKFPKCSVLVTSRPYASNYLQQLQSINRHVEVLGFTQEQIKHCIIENIPDKAKATELLQTLKERQDITSLCYIPLNCAIVLYVYKMEQCTLPHRLTELYKIFITHTLKRHAKITGNDQITMELDALAEMPESFHKHLNALSKLAYEGLVADKMVFSSKDIRTEFPESSDLGTDSSLLGLMTVFKVFTSIGEKRSYQFLHLTIQEFLAAMFAASQLSPSELLNFFQDHLKEERYRMVLLFLAGISQLSFPAKEIVFQDGMVFEHTVSTKTKINCFLFLAHLIYESQNLRLFYDLAKTLKQGSLSAAWYHMSPFDCLVLAHFLAWCDCSLKLLDLRGCGLTGQSIEIVHSVNIEHRGTTQIKEVDLSHNPQVVTKLSLLPKTPMFKHIRTIKARGLQHPEEMSPDQVELHSLLSMRHLTTLDISVKDTPAAKKGIIGSWNAVDIFKSLEHNTSLKELDLSGNWQLAEGNTEEVCCAIQRMLNVNKTLKVLNLSGCEVSDPIAKYILNGLKENTSLETLKIGSCELSCGFAVALLKQMITHPFLSIVVQVTIMGIGLVLMDRGTIVCVIGDAIAENCVDFFRALNKSGMVSKLKVQDLTDETAGHFAIGLGQSLSVEALELSHNRISSTGTVSIFKSLEYNICLKELDLSGNSQLAEGDSEAVGCAIERMLNVNTILKVLNLGGCGITNKVAEYFSNGLAQNCSVQRVVLCSNNIDSTGAVSIFRSQEYNTSLEELDLSGNSQLVEGDSKAVGRAIERMLNVNKTLKVLNLSGCRVDNTVITHIAYGMAHNASLAKLNIGANRNTITSEGWVHLFKALCNNLSLEKLNISNNELGMEGSVALAKMLSCNKSLTELNLEWCAIPAPELTEIARGLLQTTTLPTLVLCSSEKTFLKAEIKRLKKRCTVL